MEHAPELALLNAWQNFYMIFGTAAATLTGLMFVAISLAAGIERDRATLDAGIGAFNTPTVVHFGAVLLIAGMLSAPWQALSQLQVALSMLGMAGVVYLLIVMQRMRRIPTYRTPPKDWLWYMVLPLAAYVVLIAAALALQAIPELALFIIGAAMVLLLALGIHNAWDLVVYFAAVRTRHDTTGP